MSTTNLTHGILYITSYEAFRAEQFTVARFRKDTKSTFWKKVAFMETNISLTKNLINGT